jgi:hypothetical protein
VPAIYGNVKVVLSKYSGLGDLITAQSSSPPRARSVNGLAHFTNVAFSAGGDYILQASAQDVPCPALSKTITVSNRDLQTLWRLADSDFPGDQFWVMRIEHNCAKIAIAVAVLAVAGVVFVFQLLFYVLELGFIFHPTKVIGKIIFAGLYVVFFRDLIEGWKSWQCSSEYGSKLKGAVKISGVPITIK